MEKQTHSGMERRAVYVAVGMLLFIGFGLVAEYAAASFWEYMGERKIRDINMTYSLVRLGTSLFTMLPAALYFNRYVRPQAPAPADKALTLQQAFFLFMGSAVGINLVTSLLYELTWWGSYPARVYPQGGGAPAVYFVAVCIVPAVLEEMVFRGGVLRLLDGYGKTPALLFTTVLFALMHTSLWEIVIVAVLGLVLGYVAQATGKLWPCILLHFANNCLAFGTLLVQLHFPLWLAYTLAIGVRLGMLAAGIVVAVKLYRRKRAEENARTPVKGPFFWLDKPLLAALVASAAYFAYRVFL